MNEQHHLMRPIANFVEGAPLRGNPVSAREAINNRLRREGALPPRTIIFDPKHEYTAQSEALSG